MSRLTQTWRINSACAPALILAAMGSIWVGGSIALSHGYFNAGYRTLMLDAFRVELDRNMSVALVAMLLFAVLGAYLRRRGFTGKTMLLAGLMITVAPVALSLWFSPEWQVFHTRRIVTLGTWWDDVPLPAALRHQELIIGTVLAAAAGATVFALLGRKRSGAAPRGDSTRPAVGRRRQLIRGVDLRVVAPLALWALVHIASSLFGPEPAASPHNVIFLTWDSTRADHISSYGHPRTTTPTLDSLASESVMFERAYAQNNWTRPSYASILTSQFNYRVHDKGRIRDDVNTVAEILKNRGYHTVAIVQNPNLAASWGFSQGFDEYYRIIADSAPEAVNALAIPRIRALAQREQPLFLLVAAVPLIDFVQVANLILCT